MRSGDSASRKKEKIPSAKEMPVIVILPLSSADLTSLCMYHDHALGDRDTNELDILVRTRSLSVLRSR
ncbi:hypothetical protein KQX54_015032 [Cotesia glomerata]|uniref:Uncharacterized protein n=1 Tax=Cotesia glomerata TaxID=32391 RepID=A0AAV7IV55_COTGL|nr:hypothetical protein KQX54_015032 [Cotesia glomerata]